MVLRSQSVGEQDAADQLGAFSVSRSHREIGGAAFLSRISPGYRLGAGVRIAAFEVRKDERHEFKRQALRSEIEELALRLFWRCGVAFCLHCPISLIRRPLSWL